MALNQINLKGVNYVFGTSADIVSASGGYVMGRRYVVTADGFPTGAASQFGTAISATVINWDVTQAALDAVSALVAANAAAIAVNATAIATETAARIAADSTLTTNLAQEVTDRQTAVAGEASARAAADSTLTTNLATEVAARIAADSALQSAVNAESASRIAVDQAIAATLNSETAARISGDSLLTDNLAQEVIDRTFQDGLLQAQIDGIDVAYQAADSALNTSLTNALNSAVANLRDTTVADLIPVVYTAGQSSTLASLLGSGRPDGIYALSFTSDAVDKVMTVTGLPAGAVAGTGDITFGDIVRVVVDGGSVTSTVKIDDITKQKFTAIDSSISALEAATTPSAIRSNFSATGWATLTNGVINVAKSTQSGNNIIDGSDGKAYLSVQGTSIRYTKDGGLFDATVSNTVTDIYTQLSSITSGLVQAANGLSLVGGNVELGGALTKNTTVSGAYELKLSNTTKVDGVFQMPIWSVNADGSKNTKGTTYVEVWFDGNGINYSFPN